MKLLNLYRIRSNDLCVIPYRSTPTNTIYTNTCAKDGIKRFGRTLESIQKDIREGIRKKVVRNQ